MGGDVAGALSALGAAAEEARLRRQAFFAVVLAACCIGFSPIFVRLADAGPAAIGFWRLFFALGPTALWAYAEQRAARQRARVAALVATEAGRPVVPYRLVTPRQLMLSGLAGLFFAADLIMYHAGLAITTTANGVLLGNLGVVFTLLLGWLILGERPSRGLFVALFLALSGTVIIISRSLAEAGAAAPMVTGSALGDLLCVAAAACYAGFMLFVRVLRRGDSRAPSGLGTSGLGGGMVALLSSASGMVICLIWAIAAGETLLPQSVQGLLAVVGLGIVAHVGGQGLTTFALGRLPAGLISVVQLLQIVFGVGLAALLFGEIPTPAILFGGALLIAGVLTVRPRS
ncbi:DMT family transporter [Ancylobacter sp. A5.8]|uniref:DMT family transporter n=1 Tax=Ancylobacter gelatini TaxID=2919920 RepID=UPI001F4E3666|nr:DMT family transporter [Ancylobacter gelatini]MCJ8142136.1 DMT family transporter [Ancylobacter gelatini]